MSFKSMGGFDPEEAINAQRALLERIGGHVCAYSLTEEQAAQIPSDVHSQIVELFRMFRADEMSPDALKDEPFWGRLAEILREIGPSDEELDTIRKMLLAHRNRVQRPHSPQGGFGLSEH